MCLVLTTITLTRPASADGLGTRLLGFCGWAVRATPILGPLLRHRDQRHLLASLVSEVSQARSAVSDLRKTHEDIVWGHAVSTFSYIWYASGLDNVASIRAERLFDGPIRDWAGYQTAEDEFRQAALAVVNARQEWEDADSAVVVMRALDGGAGTVWMPENNYRAQQLTIQGAEREARNNRLRAAQRAYPLAERHFMQTRDAFAALMRERHSEATAYGGRPIPTEADLARQRDNARARVTALETGIVLLRREMGLPVDEALPVVAE